MSKPLPDPPREQRYSLMINWSDTNDAFVVSIPELHACTHGQTLQEAIEMAKDLIATCGEHPEVMDPMPEPLLFDDETNFAPNPFVKVRGLQNKLDQSAAAENQNKPKTPRKTTAA